MKNDDPIQIYNRLIKGFLLGAVIVAVALGVLHYFYSDVRVGGVALFNLDKERNVPTWISGALFFLISCVALIIFGAERRWNSQAPGAFRFPLLWLGVAAVGALMSLDEMTILHENLFWREVREKTQELGGAWIYLTQWQILFAPAVFAVAAFFIVFFLNRMPPRSTSFRAAAAGLLSWMTAFGLEGIRERVRDLFPAWYRVSMIAEEELELIGAALLVLALLLYLRRLLFGRTAEEAAGGGIGARFLTRRTVIGLATIAVIGTLSAAVAYTYARRSAEEERRWPGLHRKVRKQSLNQGKPQSRFADRAPSLTRQRH